MIDVIIDEGIAGDIEEPLPDEQSICRAVQAACHEAGFTHAPSLCIRFSDDATVQVLNREWRNRDSVTDVLSFPMQEEGDFHADESLGDIILATPFTIAEANRLSLPPTDHMLHLIIHATLHLLGYDHIDDKDAEIMHTCERAAMKQLGLHDPYPDENEDEQHV